MSHHTHSDTTTVGYVIQDCMGRYLASDAPDVWVCDIDRALFFEQRLVDLNPLQGKRAIQVTRQHTIDTRTTIRPTGQSAFGPTF